MKRSIAAPTAVVAVRAGAASLAIFAALAAPSTARADVAPPPFAPGAGVGPSRDTNVRMVSERVVLTVADAVTPANRHSDNASDRMIGRVEATFVLRNDGAAPETMDVRFPVRRDEYEIAISEGFEATVAGVPAAIEFTDGDGQPFPEATAAASSPDKWAAFPGTFPPGADVEVTVRYDVRPTGYPPYGTFGYVLDTGAAWAGTIGDAEVRVRLPYDVNETNVALNADSMWDTGPLPAGFVVDGTDVVWRFTDLEPTEADNIRLTVLEPAIWRSIVAARAAVAIEPPAAAAELALATALHAALYTDRDVGVVTVADSDVLAAEAKSAFERAIELAPDSADAWVAYAEFLDDTEVALLYGDFSAEARRTIERALELAPDDPRLKWLRSMRTDHIERAPRWTADAATAAAAAPTAAAPSDVPTGGAPPDAKRTAEPLVGTVPAGPFASTTIGLGVLAVIAAALAALLPLRRRRGR